MARPASGRAESMAESMGGDFFLHACSKRCFLDCGSKTIFIYMVPPSEAASWIPGKP